jgi:hypothetical protein
VKQLKDSEAALLEECDRLTQVQYVCGPLLPCWWSHDVVHSFLAVGLPAFHSALGMYQPTLLSMFIRHSLLLYAYVSRVL